MPSTPAHNARQAAISGWRICTSLSFKWCIVLDLLGLALLVTGLTLVSVGYSPSDTRPSRMGDIPVDSGNKPMQISGCVILPIGVICFFTGLALTVRSVRTVPRERDRVVSAVNVTIRNRQPVNGNRPAVQNSAVQDVPIRFANVTDTGIYSQLPVRAAAPRLSTTTNSGSDVFYIEQYDVTPRRTVPQVNPTTLAGPYTHTPYYSRGRMYDVTREYEGPPPPFNPNYNSQRY